MHECWSNIHMLPGSSICQVFFFPFCMHISVRWQMLCSQITHCLHLYTCMHMCVCFSPSQSVLPFFICLQEGNKICTGVQISLKTIVAINKAESQGFFQIPPALAILCITSTLIIKKMLTPWRCLVIPSLLYHSTPNHTVAVNGGCSLGSY